MEDIFNRKQLIMNPLKTKLSAIREQCRQRLMSLHLKFLQLIYGKRSVPLSYWLTFQSVAKLIFRSPDPLFPGYKSLQSRGASLQVQELRQLLWNDVLGLWAIDRTTVELLWRRIQCDRPKVVIECGAGASSLILAKYAALSCSAPMESCVVFSLEQDMHIKQTIEGRLAESGLSEHVKILYAPISEEGKYQLDTDRLWELLGTKRADWLFIDGPAGPGR